MIPAEAGARRALDFLLFFAYGIAMATAFVTGASRGVGRGVAAELATQGFRVFATGRSIESAELPASVERIQCDHKLDTDTAAAARNTFKQPAEPTLVNRDGF